MFQSESISCPKWAEIPFFFFKTSCRMKINTHRLSWMKRSDFSYSTGPWSVSRRVNCPSCGTSNGGIQSLSRHLPCFLLLFVCVVWLLQPDVSGCPWCLPIESLWRWTATADHESAWPNVNIELCLGGGGGIVKVVLAAPICSLMTQRNWITYTVAMVSSSANES